MTRLVSFCLLAAACNGTTNAVLTDLGPGERVWVSGTWQDNSARAGLIDARAELPVVPTDLVPDHPHDPVETLGTGTSRAIDLTADGTRMAFVAEDSFFDSIVYVASGDGSAPIQLYETANTVADIMLSPDGASLLLLIDLDLREMYDLFVMDIAHPENGLTKLSPDRPQNAEFLNVTGFSWSATSRYVTLMGALTDASYNELYVVDLHAGLFPLQRTALLSRDQILVPEAATGPKGVWTVPVFDADDRIWYGAATANALDAPADLYEAPPGIAPIKVALPPRADSTTSGIQALAISPDGLHIAYAADAPIATAYETYYAATSAPTVRTQLTNNAVPVNAYYSALAFSPDGTQLAISANFDDQYSSDLYMLDVAGGSQTHLAAFLDGHGGDLLAWSAGPQLWCVGSLSSDVNDLTPHLYRLDPTASLQTPELAISSATVADVSIR